MNSRTFTRCCQAPGVKPRQATSHCSLASFGLVAMGFLLRAMQTGAAGAEQTLVPRRGAEHPTLVGSVSAPAAGVSSTSLDSLFEIISQRLAETWRSREPPRRGRAYRCRCGRPVFFRNSQCLACGAPLGYEPAVGEVRALEPGADAGAWRLSGAAEAPQTYRRCANFDSPAGCNWLVPAEDPVLHCRACRLNRTIPDLSDTENQRYWRAIENAKRRLVSQLIALGLPVRSKVHEDPERGVAFDFLRSLPGGPRVLTGHASGFITLNAEEA